MRRDERPEESGTISKFGQKREKLTKLQIRITTQQILVRNYLINPIFRTGKPFLFRESLCVTCALCIKYYIQNGT